VNWVVHSWPLKELGRGSRRMYCDWEMVDRIRADGIGMLVPDVQAFREFATLLQLKARLQMADGQYGDAVTTLRTGITLGRHIAEAPTLIQGLVGMAIISLMLKEVEEMAQHPNAPNLYWALSNLPTPLTTLRRGLEGERIFLYATFPVLEEMDKRPLTVKEQEQVLQMTRALAADGPGAMSTVISVAAVA